MATFKNGDKVKIPTIGTACIRTSSEEIQKSLFDYKLDYLYVCDVWEDGEIGLMRGDGKVFEQDLYHERDLEHYNKYNETFNPEAHSSLIIDFDKVETIEEYLNRGYPNKGYDEEYYCDLNKDVIKPHTLKVVLSEAVKNYWYSQFLKEHGRS